MKKNNYLLWPISLILVSVTFWIVSMSYFDNDGWFILSTGRYIMTNGIPKKNPFTFISDLDIIVQQWLWSVICYKMMNVFGKIGLYTMTIFLYVLNGWIFIKIGRLKNTGIDITFLSYAGIMLFCSAYINIRPTLVTITLILWQIYTLEKYKTGKNHWVLISLIFISLLEINLHSAIWVIHLIICLPYIVPPVKTPICKFAPQRYNKIPIYISMLVMAICGFINPYGMKGIMYLFKSYGKQLKGTTIKEMQPLQISSFYGILFLAILITGIVMYFMRANVDSNLAYLYAGFMVLGAMHVRNLIYTVLAALVLSLFIFEGRKTKISKLPKFTIEMVSLISAIVTIMLSVSIIGNLKKSIPKEDEWCTPVSAVEYLNNNTDKDVKIYTTIDNGGFFEWNGYKSYVDARPELFFKSVNGKEEIFKEANRIYTRPTIEDIESFIAKYKFDYLLFRKTDSIGVYLATQEGYECVVDTGKYQLYKAKN